MPITKRSDLIIPELLMEAISAAFPKMRVLMGSKAVIINGTMPNTINGSPMIGGDQIKFPYFNLLGDSLEKIVNEGDELIPTKLTMTSDLATVGHYGKAVEITQWAQLAAAYADPYGEVAKQFVEMTANTVENELLRVSVAGLPALYVHDVFSATTPKTLDYDTMIDAKILWGDEQGNIELLTVHSKVYGDLLKLKDSTGRPLVTDANNAEIQKFAGVPLKVSDRNTVTVVSGVNRYSSLIFKAGAVAWWYQKAATVRTEGNALADSDITAIHIYGAPYRYLRPTSGGTKSGVIEIRTN